MMLQGHMRRARLLNELLLMLPGKLPLLPSLALSQDPRFYPWICCACISVDDLACVL